ncbi:MAG: hypothetical protein LBE05_04885 [Microbacterium sp.]|jgi:hypothetical protein|nr:hypothetical protein [Microbacterium sp.]
MATSRNTNMRPGNTVPASGIYAQYQGGRKVNEVTSVMGEPFPPGPAAGTTYRPVRLTK